MPPRTAAETILTGITAELLGRDEIGIEEDFFELGIDSILGIQLIARARVAGLRLSPCELFRHPTIAMLEAAEQEPASEHSPIDSFPSTSPFELAAGDIDLAAVEAELACTGGIEDLYPLTSVQEGMLFHTFTDPARRDCTWRNFAVGCKARSTSTSSARRGAGWWRGTPRCGLHSAGRGPAGLTRSCTARPNHRSISTISAIWPVRDNGRQIEADLQNDRQAGLNVAVPPLMHLALYQTGDQTHELIWRIHHVIVNGWCLSILLGEVLDLYEGCARTGATSPPAARFVITLPGSCQDFSAAGAYWRESLRGITSPTPLGLDRRPIQPQGDSQELFQERETLLSAELTERLRTLARTSQVTLSTLIQGAWALLLSRYSGQRDVVFGFAVSGRPPELPASNP